MLAQLHDASLLAMASSSAPAARIAPGDQNCGRLARSVELVLVAPVLELPVGAGPHDDDLAHASDSPISTRHRKGAPMYFLMSLVAQLFSCGRRPR